MFEKLKKAKEKNKPKLTLEKARQLIDLKIREGQGKEAIKTLIVNRGIDENVFESEYKTILSNLETELENSKLDGGSILPGFLGGLVSAVLAAIAWTFIVVLTDYEVGYMAIGVGLLVGYAVFLVSGRKRARILQIFAVFWAAVSIVIAKYFMVYYFVKDMVKTEYGEVAAQEVRLFGKEIFQIMTEEFSNIFTGYDILWLVLAVWIAWSIPARFKINKK